MVLLLKAPANRDYGKKTFYDCILYSILNLNILS